MGEIKIEPKKDKKWEKRAAFKPGVPHPPKRAPHYKRVDDTCKICAHSNCGLIEELYLNRKSIAEVLTYEGLTRAEWNRHRKGLRLGEERAKSTMSIYKTYVDKGAEAMRGNEVSPTAKAKLGLIAAQHIDKLEGRIVEKRQVKEERHLVIEAFPAPGAPIMAKMLAPAKERLSEWADMDAEERQVHLDELDSNDVE